MVAVNGIYRLSILGTSLGQQHVVTHHFRSTLAGNAVALSEPAFQQALIDSWQANARTEYRAVFSSSDSPCQLYQVRKVCGALPLPAGIDETESAGSIAGTASKTGEALMPWLAQNVTWRTANAGRSYRGRTYFGGLWEQDTAVATVGAGRMNSVAAYCAKLKVTYIDPLETAVDWKLFVFSRVLSVRPGFECHQAGADVTNYQTRDQVASMKSRKAGSGL